MYPLLMVFASVLCLVGGGLVVWGERAGIFRGAGEESSVDAARPGGLSIATRYLIGLVLLIWGYHLGVWAFPTSRVALGAIQFPRSAWWVVAVVGLGACAMSVLVDRWERRSAE